MTYKITIGALTSELKDSIYKDFADHAISTMGFNGLSDEPIAFEINDNGINIGVCVCQLFWGNLHIKYLITRIWIQGARYRENLDRTCPALWQRTRVQFCICRNYEFSSSRILPKTWFSN